MIVLLLLLMSELKCVLSGRVFSSKEMLNVKELFMAKNNIKIADCTKANLDQISTGDHDESNVNSINDNDWESDESKPTTFYGPYYMFKGRVYKRKSYTREPTVPKPSQKSSSTFITISKRSWSPWTRRTTPKKNKTTFYGPYYMFKGKLISRKSYTKEPTKKIIQTLKTKSTTIPYWNRTTSYGPFFMFGNKVYSRRRYTLEPTIKRYPWQKTSNTRWWTGVYPFSTEYWERITVPECVRRRPAGQIAAANPNFEELHESNPKPFSDLEISNDTSLAQEANAYIKEHFNMDNYVDSEMYLTQRPTVAQTYKHGFYFGKYPTIDWTNDDQDMDFIKRMRISRAQEWTLEMLRFSYDPNYSTTPIVRPPWVPNSAVERYYA